MESPKSISDEDRELLDVLLDRLVPPNPGRGVPGAGELGVAEPLIARASGDGDLGSALRALLERASLLERDLPPEAVRRLEAELPDAFGRILVETYKGYYGRPDMRAKMGAGAEPAHPGGHDVAPETAETIDALVAPVRARGPVWRDPSRAKGGGDGA